MSCPVCAGHDSAKCPCCGEGLKMAECPDCHGTGKTPWTALNLDTKEIVKVTETAWRMLPEDEDMARHLAAQGKRQNFIQYEEGGFRCPTCYGDGVIEEED